MSTSADDDDMKLVAAHDHGALERLLGRHGDAVYGYCMRVLAGNRAAVEDVTQEVWLKVVRAAGSYRPEGHFRAWLMTITRNAVITMVRKEIPGHLRDEEPEEVAGDFDLEAELLRRYDLAKIREAVDGLVASQRAVFMLWLEEDASYEVIGERLGLPLVSVRSILQRARDNLRKRLEKK